MKKTFSAVGALITGMSLLAPVAMAKDVGVIGTVYPIGEEDFLQLIHDRLQQKQASGELARWQSDQAQAILHQADRPPPVAGLKPTLQTKSWLYDPTLVLSRDITDGQGNVRLPAGTHINPLDKVIWKKTLLFYNADNADQVAWAVKQSETFQGQVTLVLTQGSVASQTKLFGKPVYFDQGGQLVQRFGIQNMPATVMQAGRQLRVTEVKP